MSSRYNGYITQSNQLPAVPINSAPDSSVVLVMNFNGSNGGNVFTDSSTSNLTFTAVGNSVYTSNTQYKYGNASLYLGGSSSYIYTPNNSVFNFGTNDFTIEWWMFCVTPWTSQINPGVIGQKGGDGSNGWQIYKNGSMNTSEIGIRLSQQLDVFNNAPPSTGVWEHYAVSRNNTVVRWFKNGILTNTSTSAANLVDNSAPCNIGHTDTWGGTTSGIYIDDLRVANGKAIYTTNFSPPGEISSSIAIYSSNYGIINIY